MMSWLIVVLISLINVAALLLGWFDVRSYFADGPRSVVFVVLAVAPPLMLWLGPNAGGGHANHVRRQRGRILPGLMIMMPFGYAFAAAAMRHSFLTWPPLPPVRWLGVALFVLGWVVILLAIRTLGRHYSVFVTVQAEHRLIRHGVYRYLRHPIYAGFIIWVLGLALIFGSVVPLIFWLMVTAGALRKMRQEERFLAAQFPEEYPAYCRRTWRLLPYVY